MQLGSTIIALAVFASSVFAINPLILENLANLEHLILQEDRLFTTLTCRTHNHDVICSTVFQCNAQNQIVVIPGTPPNVVEMNRDYCLDGRQGACRCA